MRSKFSRRCTSFALLGLCLTMPRVMTRVETHANLDQRLRSAGAGEERARG